MTTHQFRIARRRTWRTGLCALCTTLMFTALLLGVAPLSAQDSNQENAEPDSENSGRTTERRSPSWRPQAPQRPEIPQRPPAMERPEPEFRVSRPEVDLPILDLGSENVAAKPPELDNDEATTDEATTDEQPLDAPDTGPALVTPIEQVAEQADADSTATTETQPQPAVAQEAVQPGEPAAGTVDDPEASSGASDQAVAESGVAPDAQPAASDPAASDPAASDPAASDDEPPVEVSTAAVLPREQEPALPDLDEEAEAASRPRPADSVEVPESSALTDSGSAPTELVATRWVRPTYPRGAYRQGTEGWVKLRVTVDPAGQIEDIALVDSQPRGVFVREAVRAANQWEFEALANNVPQVNRSKTYQIDFTLGQ